MKIRANEKVQHYRVIAEDVNSCEVGDPIFSSHDWAPDSLGFITAVYKSSSEIDICLFEQMSAPDTMTHVIAHKLTEEEVEALLMAR